MSTIRTWKVIGVQDNRNVHCVIDIFAFQTHDIGIFKVKQARIPWFSWFRTIITGEYPPMETEYSEIIHKQMKAMLGEWNDIWKSDRKWLIKGCLPYNRHFLCIFVSNDMLLVSMNSFHRSLNIRNNPGRKNFMRLPTYRTSDSSDVQRNLYSFYKNIPCVNTMAVQAMIIIRTVT